MAKQTRALSLEELEALEQTSRKTQDVLARFGHHPHAGRQDGRALGADGQAGSHAAPWRRTGADADHKVIRGGRHDAGRGGPVAPFAIAHQLDDNSS